MPIWFHDLHQVYITLTPVAVFIMITGSLINAYHGVDLAEKEI